jgi:hypothetical protein
MNSVKLSNLDNNPLLIEITDEESAAVNGGGIISVIIKNAPKALPALKKIGSAIATGAALEAGKQLWNKITGK